MTAAGDAVEAFSVFGTVLSVAVLVAAVAYFGYDRWRRSAASAAVELALQELATIRDTFESESVGALAGVPALVLSVGAGALALTPRDAVLALRRDGLLAGSDTEIADLEHSFFVRSGPGDSDMDAAHFEALVHRLARLDAGTLARRAARDEEKPGRTTVSVAEAVEGVQVGLALLRAASKSPRSFGR